MNAVYSEGADRAKHRSLADEIAVKVFEEMNPAEPPAALNPKAIPGRRKPQIDAIPLNTLFEIGAVFRNGADKYGLKNWRDDRISMSDYLNAIFRHFQAISEGEDIDPVVPADPSMSPGSGKRHLAHIAATCIIVMDAMDHGTMSDDRWKPRVAA